MTYLDVLNNSAALLSDPLREVFTDAVQLAYLNIALSELQEMFELNNIPSTKETSALINVPSGTISIGFPPATPDVGEPYLPIDLIEIQQLYESPMGQENWTPVAKRNYLTNFSTVNQSTSFGVWAWMDQEIRLLPSLQVNDLKLDYIKSLFVPIALGDLDEMVTILNSSSFLQYRTAGLCAEYISEDMTRAGTLNGLAAVSLNRSLGISVKGQQSVMTRRRPFRASWKRRGIIA